MPGVDAHLFAFNKIFIRGNIMKHSEQTNTFINFPPLPPRMNFCKVILKSYLQAINVRARHHKLTNGLPSLITRKVFYFSAINAVERRKF